MENGSTLDMVKRRKGKLAGNGQGINHVDGIKTEIAANISEFVSKEQAMNILKQYLGENNLAVLSISDKFPERCRLWGLPDDANCWFVKMSYYPRHAMMQSGRLVCISKDGGEVIYDGACIG